MSGLKAFSDGWGSHYVSPCCKEMEEEFSDEDRIPPYITIDGDGVNWLEPETERWKIRQSCPFCGKRLKYVKSPDKLDWEHPIYWGNGGLVDEDSLNDLKEVLE